MVYVNFFTYELEICCPNDLALPLYSLLLYFHEWKGIVWFLANRTQSKTGKRNARPFLKQERGFFVLPVSRMNASSKNKNGVHHGGCGV